MGWLTLVLAVDHGADHPTQAVLGLLTWAVLVAALRHADSTVRMQTAVVVLFATVIEVTASLWLGVYTYRLGNLPAYVPPGHGLVYLSAVSLGHEPFVRQRLSLLLPVTLAVLGTWAGYGLVVADRQDVLGGCWMACLVGFAVWGPSREVYVGAAAVVTWLELVGTHLHTWTWSTHDPTGWILIGNPPTGVAGGYGWFDLVALLATPWLLARWRGLAASRPNSGRRSERKGAARTYVRAARSVRISSPNDST